MSGSRPAGCFIFLAAAVAALEVVPRAAQQPADLPVVRLESIFVAQPAGIAGFPATRLAPGPAAGDLDSVSAGSLAFSQPLPIRDAFFFYFEARRSASCSTLRSAAPLPAS